MDDQNKSVSADQPIASTSPNNPQPVAQQSELRLHPSESFLQEMQTSSPSAPVPPPADQSQVQNSLPQPPKPQSGKNSPNLTERYNITSIYPDAPTEHNNKATDTIAEPFMDRESPSAITFANGFDIGATIFWFQVIAGILLYLATLALTFFLLDHTHSLVIDRIASLIVFATGLLVAIYIPYSVIKSNNIVKPIWLTAFGVPLGAILDLILFFVFETLFYHLLLERVSFVSLHPSVTSAVIGIALLVASYYVMKLTYGITFRVYQRINNADKFRVISIAMIAIIIVGGIVSHFFNIFGLGSLFLVLTPLG